ncbi:MAG: hypothetical protein P1P83_08385 [Bacteroidales bacterium]|nr:hypothetical protein [Bacteroidales bacterium]MDT8373456.1 hypothetical protein [Bacteroidales bacterium]
MTLDNGKKIVLLRLIGFITTLVYVLYIFLAYFPKIFRHAMSETSVNIMTAVVTAAFLLVLLWPAVMKYRYIWFSADERSITLRWYKTGVVPGESKSIEIPTERFAGFEMTKKALGLHHYLTLFQQVQGRRAAYSPVSVTALSARQRKEIADTLSNYISAV